MNNKDFKDKYEIARTSFDKINQSTKGELYFLIIGINEYKKELNLNHCKNEANDFLKIFNKNNDIKSKNIYSIFDYDATKTNIMHHFKKFNNLLSENDRLVIYFAGHGHKTEFANFFIPYDGEKKNYLSCIPDSLISKSINDIRSNSILLFYDLKFSTSEFKSYKEQSTISLFSEARNKIAHSSSKESYYTTFIDFFSKTNKNRIKEAFFLLKEEPKATDNHHPLLNFNINNPLYNKLQEEYDSLLYSIKENQLNLVLENLSKILENNDSDLFSRVETLQYKLLEIEKTSRTSIINNKIDDREAITQIACEVIEKINQNGFYLLKTPKELEDNPTINLPKTKILFASANPRDQDFLRLEKESKEIEYELMKAKFRDNFEFIKIRNLNVNELQDALLNQSPQFLHFSGHGSCEGLALLNDLDEAKIVETKPLAQLFNLFSNEINCIFLNSCHSIEQSKEISKYIKKVICMNNAVPDDVAIHFATAFYKSIGAGKDIDFSFDFAKNSIDLNCINGSDIPVLLPAK